MSGAERSKEKIVQGALRSELTCYKCHQPGPFRRDFRVRVGNNEARQSGQGGFRGGFMGDYGGRGRTWGQSQGRGYGGSGAHGAQRVESQNDDTYEDMVLIADTKSSSTDECWLIDSGASRHMTSEKNCLGDYQQFKEKEPVTLGNGKIVEALGEGNVKLQLGHRKTGTLKNVLYVPKLSCNLLSVGAAAEQNLTVGVGKNNCRFKTRDGQTVASGTWVNRMYQLNCRSSEEAQVVESNNRLKLWH